MTQAGVATEAAASVMTRAQARFVESVERQAAALGKTRAELLRFRAEQLGVAEAAAPAIQRIAAFNRALQDGVAKSASLSREQLLALKYTTSDVVASLASGASPLTILLQQGGQVAQVSGGIGGILRGLAAAATPVRIALSGAAGAVGGFALAMYQGAQQSKEFNDAIVLTGNYAGQTAGQFTEAARRIAASGQVSIAAAREFGQALISTGNVGPGVFEKATEAAARYGAATGKNAQDVAADFAAMGDDVAKWATDHNKQLNFVSVAQLEHIRRLQEQGRAVDAQRDVYDALNIRLRGLEPNLGTLDRTLRAVANTWRSFWDATLDVGRETTVEDKIAQARAALENAGRVGSERVSQTQLDPQRRAQLAYAGAQGTGQAENAQEYLRLLLRSQAATQATSASTAELLRLNKEVGADQTVIEGFQRQAKAAAGLNRELAQMEARFKRQDELAEKDPSFKANAAFTSAADRAAILAKVRENYTDKGGANAANRLRKADLDQDLAAIRDRFQAEQQAVRFSQQELQALYSAGSVSLADYFQRRRATIDQGTTAAAAELKEGEARIRQAIAGASDPVERTQGATKLAANLAEQAKVRAEAAQATRLANIEEAESFRQLEQRVTEFRAQVLQLAGDEQTAARLRAQVAIENAQRSATQAGDLIDPAEVERFKALAAASVDFAEAQRRVQQVTTAYASVEDAFLLRATQGGLSLLEVDKEVYEIRSRQLEQLGLLRDQVQALAEQSTDPKIKQYAADLAAQYAKAAENINPALSRLRDAGKDFADGISADLAGVVVKFTSIKDLGASLYQTFQQTLQKIVQAPIQQALEGYVRRGIDSLSGNVASAGKEATKAAEAAAQSAAITANATANTTATLAVSSMATAAQLAASALLRVAASGSVSGLGSFGGGGFGTGADYGDLDYGAFLAEGTNKVPYDGFKAILHKDEAVVPARFNPAAGGAGAGRPPSVQIFNAPAGTDVDRTESEGDQTRVFLKQAEGFMAGRLARGRGALVPGLNARGVNTSGALAKRG